MAAQETFDTFNMSLTPKLRIQLAVIMKETAESLLEARSEDARNRLVEEYMVQVRESSKEKN